MKATRIEYMHKMHEFFSTHEFAKNSLLEISGNTKEFHQFFTDITTTQFPEVDAEDLPYDDHTFDCVVMNQVLEHCRRPWTCVEEAYRVLRKGGVCVLSSPFFYQVHDWPGDFYRFTPEGLEVLGENAGFNEVILNHRAGNASMIKYVIDFPNDRSSDRFLSIAQTKEDKSKYFMISTVVLRK